MPKISVIMSVYNERPTFLKEAVESILNQTWNDFEFIVVDDQPHSSQNLLLESYQKQDARIVLLKNEHNIGLTRSLNRAIEQAQGDYIARMDSDDKAFPDRLKNQLVSIERTQADLIATPCIRIDHTGKELGPLGMIEAPHPQSLLIRGNPFVHPTFFGTRKIFQEKYNPGFRRAQDYEFLLRVTSLGYRIEFLATPTLWYRENPESISQKHNREQEWYGIKARVRAITRYGYGYLGWWFVARSFLLWFFPYRFKKWLHHTI